MSWSAAQYLAFEDDRTRPVRDLVAAIPPTAARSVVDIGCGPGNSTELLAARFPTADILGLDNSANMLDAARKRLPLVRFEQADIAGWAPEARFDGILANAVLQWLPDHHTLLPRLVGLLQPGGSLAVQMPENLDEPAYVQMRAAAADGPWATRLSAAEGLRPAMETAHGYYRILKPHCTRVDVWRTTYLHVMPNVDGIVEWFKGSGLRPYLAPLDESERGAFLARYRAGLAETHPAMPDGSVLLPFPRLFIVATR